MFALYVRTGTQSVRYFFKIGVSLSTEANRFFVTQIHLANCVSILPQKYWHG